MKRFSMLGVAWAATVFLSMIAAGCGSHGDMMDGPSPSAKSGTMLLSVTPAGGATGVSTSAAIMLRFSARMAAGMEPFVDLHQGGLDGPAVPMHCEFSSDRTILTCVPGTPLRAHLAYTLHIGGGMMDFDDHPIDMDQYRGTMGGQWIEGGMMGSFHDTSPWGMMGGNWRGTNGSYGMAFPFTTG